MLVIEASSGFSEEEAGRGQYKIGEGVTGKVAESGKPRIIQDISPFFTGSGRPVRVACALP
jgi:Nif-specific regulatory protein